MQAIKILNMIKLYGKPIRVNKVSCLKRPVPSSGSQQLKRGLCTVRRLDVCMGKRYNLNRSL